MLRELLDEPTGLDEVGDSFEPQDELAVRSIMIRLEQLGRDADAVKARKAAVVRSYDEQIQRIEEQAEWLRRSLAAWVERQGKATFPDVGTAYLSSGKPKLRIIDRDAFRDHTADVFVKETWDETWAKNYYLERALESGEVPPGCELVPGGPELRVRKAAT
jgi:hypothetical protein